MHKDSDNAEDKEKESVQEFQEGSDHKEETLEN